MLKKSQEKNKNTGRKKKGSGQIERSTKIHNFAAHLRLLYTIVMTDQSQLSYCLRHLKLKQTMRRPFMRFLFFHKLDIHFAMYWKILKESQVYTFKLRCPKEEFHYLRWIIFVIFF